MNLRVETHVETDVAARAEENWGYRFPVRDQNFCVLSIAETAGETPCGVKVFGCYPTLEAANAAAKEIADENDFFSVMIAETSEWLAVPASRQYVEEVEYREELLQNLQESCTKLRERRAKDVISKIKKEGEKMIPPSEEKERELSEIELPEEESELPEEEIKVPEEDDQN